MECQHLLVSCFTCGPHGNLRWNRPFIKNVPNGIMIRVTATFIGQWCGSVGRAVTSDSRGLRFESSHRQKFILNIVNCQLYWKDDNKGKEAGTGPFKKTTFIWSPIDVNLFVLFQCLFYWQLKDKFVTSSSFQRIHPTHLTEKTQTKIKTFIF